MICHATAPKTLPQHIPRKLQRISYSGFSRSATLPQHIPRKLQRRQDFRQLVHHALCLSTSRANCNKDPRHNSHVTMLLCLSTSRANCNLQAAGRVDRHPLCLSTSRANCNDRRQQLRAHRAPLPQHIPRKLQPAPWTARRTSTPALPQHIPRKLQPAAGNWGSAAAGLCLSTSRANCNLYQRQWLCLPHALPQHIPRKLQRRKTQMFFHLIVL